VVNYKYYTQGQTFTGDGGEALPSHSLSAQIYSIGKITTLCFSDHVYIGYSLLCLVEISKGTATELEAARMMTATLDV
jgi:hypothetical protein